MNTAVRCAIAGAGGAAILTMVHELARDTLPEAPRMDIIGRRGVAEIRDRVGAEPADRDSLYQQSLAGDLLINTAMYAVVGMGSRDGVWARGLGLGLLAGVGGLLLPRPLGLGDPPGSNRRDTQLMTIAWYALGGLAAAYVAHGLYEPGD